MHEGCFSEEGEALRILVPGTVLLDIYSPGGERFLGGAEFNFAYHAHHLRNGGLDFLARVGKDEPGQFILRELASRGFPTVFIQQDPLRPTKTVRVEKDACNRPTYRIPDNVASEYLELPNLPSGAIETYELIYFGTTLQHGAQSRETLRHILELGRGIKFCDLNLRPPKFSPEVVEYSLRTCDFLKINHEELETISGIFSLSGSREGRLATLARRFEIDGLCLTLAEAGSWLLRGGEFYQKSLEAVEVKDTVGAGDAFSAMLAVGLLEGWGPEKMLDCASALAGAVCQIQGAVPSDPQFYSRFL